MYVSRWQGVLLVVALVAVLAWSCTDNKASDDDEGGIVCAQASDCPIGTLCEWRRCRAICASAPDCPAPLHCHPRGVCTECAAQVDCEANTYCFRGRCMDASELDADVRYGVACETLEQCLNGEICRAGRCTPLCQEEADCRPPRGLCHPERFCVQCLKDGDCKEGSACVEGRCESSGEPITCDPACDLTAGEYCNEGLGECQKVRCMSCDKDSDCAAAERCRADRSVNGNRICLLIDASVCPAGYLLDDEKVCRPVALCADVTYSDIAQPCRFAGDRSLNACAKGLRCLYSSRVSFCAPPCTATDDCAEHFPEGCCGSFSGGQAYCHTPDFCAMPGFCDVEEGCP